MKDIEKILKNIFTNRLGVDFDKLGGNLRNEHLLGRRIGLEPSDLIYLLRDIEVEFEIEVPQEDIGAGKFSTFNNIVSIISNQI